MTDEDCKKYNIMKRYIEIKRMHDDISRDLQKVNHEVLNNLDVDEMAKYLNVLNKEAKKKKEFDEICSQ